MSPQTYVAIGAALVPHLVWWRLGGTLLAFFLAVGLTLLLGLLLKKATWKKLVGMAVAFILTMGLAYLIANPFLFSHWARTAYQYILYKQGGLLENG